MTSTKKKHKSIVALHRYFIWANMMRTQFHATFSADPSSLEIWSGDSIERTAYLSYWYAALHVVVEGWRRLRLHDAEIEKLLGRTDMIRLLRDHRHAVFHFSPHYYDDRLMAFLKGGADSARWARHLNRAFGRYLLAYSENHQDETRRRSR